MTAFVRRREVNKLLGGAVAWPLVARAEPADRMRRIGVLMGVAKNDPEGQARVAAFEQGLADLNWADGRNVRIEYRWAAGDVDRIRAYTRELVALAPDVLVGNGTPALRALRDATDSSRLSSSWSTTPSARASSRIWRVPAAISPASAFSNIP